MEQLGHPRRRKWIKELKNAPFWSARAQDSPVWVGPKHRDGAELRARGRGPRDVHSGQCGEEEGALADPVHTLHGAKSHMASHTWESLLYSQGKASH